ncbi:MAG TPA: hypothetical protein VII79_07565 [Candidatus Dormibacteraeota bacterium]
MKLFRIGAIATFALTGWTAGAIIAATPAAACAIAPATPTCAPDVLTISTSATVVASASGTITPTPPNFTADWVEKVFKDPANTLCTSPGNCLTWIVEITGHIPNGSTDVIQRVTVSNFQGFTIDLGYINPPNTAPGMTNPPAGNVPNNVSRSTNGSTLSWDFNTATTEIRDGQSTVLLEAETSATTVVPGTISVQDGTAGGTTAFGPALPEVPWVPVLGLFGGALAGGMLYRRGRRVSG